MQFLNHLFSRFFGTKSLRKVQSGALSNSVIAPSPKDSKSKKSFSKYRPQRVRYLYDPKSPKPFKLSRSRIENFMRCKRCFYLDRRLGVGHPPGYPFSLNIAVDALLKKEFDTYRSEQKPHPICFENGIEVIPFSHNNLDSWRNNKRGIRYHHRDTNFVVTGAVDDIWINPKGELIVVDYKATSKKEEVSLDAEWQIGYKRQMEIYQWLFRKNGFKVSDTGYFVYCNGKKNLDSFDKQLHFDVSLLPYAGDDSWVEGAIMQAYKCLQSTEIPPLTESCDYCQYWNGVNKHIFPK